MLIWLICIVYHPLVHSWTVENSTCVPASGLWILTLAILHRHLHRKWFWIRMLKSSYQYTSLLGMHVRALGSWMVHNDGSENPSSQLGGRNSSMLITTTRWRCTLTSILSPFNGAALKAIVIWLSFRNNLGKDLVSLDGPGARVMVHAGPV